MGSQFSSKLRAKRGVSVSRTRTHLDQLQPTTNSDKLSEHHWLLGVLEKAVGMPYTLCRH